jgi:hypothetical protein
MASDCENSGDSRFFMYAPDRGKGEASLTVHLVRVHRCPLYYLGALPHLLLGSNIQVRGQISTCLPRVNRVHRHPIFRHIQGVESVRFRFQVLVQLTGFLLSVIHFNHPLLAVQHVGP